MQGHVAVKSERFRHRIRYDSYYVRAFFFDFVSCGSVQPQLDEAVLVAVSVSGRIVDGSQSRYSGPAPSLPSNSERRAFGHPFLVIASDTDHIPSKRGPKIR